MLFFLLCTYCKSYIPHTAALATTLCPIIEKHARFLWTADCGKAFVALKGTLLSPPVLGYPRTNSPLILNTDASKSAIGAVLRQVQGNSERAIAYYSRARHRVERHYCATRKELLAVLKAVRHFHHYLYARGFPLRTDHASLT